MNKDKLEESLQKATEELVKKSGCLVPDFKTAESPAREIRNLAYDLYQAIDFEASMCQQCMDMTEDYSCQGFEDWNGQPCWYIDFANALYEKGWRHKENG